MRSAHEVVRVVVAWGSGSDSADSASGGAPPAAASSGLLFEVKQAHIFPHINRIFSRRESFAYSAASARATSCSSFSA